VGGRLVSLGEKGLSENTKDSNCALLVEWKAEFSGETWVVRHRWGGFNNKFGGKMITSVAELLGKNKTINAQHWKACTLKRASKLLGKAPRSSSRTEGSWELSLECFGNSRWGSGW